MIPRWLGPFLGARSALRRLPRYLIAGLAVIGVAWRGAPAPGGLRAARTFLGAAVNDRPAPMPAFATAASMGAAELAGLGQPSLVAWSPKSGLWGGHSRPAWWQSALAVRTLVRYLEMTHTTSPGYQHVLLATFDRNVANPYRPGKFDFANQYMDDTGWWGLAWLEASRYELRIVGDRAAAAKFLAVAEWDANYIASQPKPCGGIAWEQNYPPDTIASAEFIALTAGLSAYTEGPGYFHDAYEAAVFLGDARGALKWLEASELVHIRSGKAADRLGGGCKRLIGGPLPYTEGEVAAALDAVGAALHDRAYYTQAGRFLRFLTSPASKMLVHGVLQEPCEREHVRCGAESRLNGTAYKGIFVQAVYDWSLATGSHAYRSFLLAQAAAVLKNSIDAVPSGRTECGTPATCQFGVHWARSPTRRSAFGDTVGTQASAVDALTAAAPYELVQPLPAPQLVPHTSTTTGSTIGRRLSRS